MLTPVLAGGTAMTLVTVTTGLAQAKQWPSWEC